MTKFVICRCELIMCMPLTIISTLVLCFQDVVAGFRDIHGFITFIMSCVRVSCALTCPARALEAAFLET